MKVLAVDPGNKSSGYVIMDAETCRPAQFGIASNEHLLEMLYNRRPDLECVVIERIASYGMAVGREVFETCEWVGRFCEAATHSKHPVYYIYRKEEKEFICQDLRAKDANIRRALIDRFADHDLKNGKGTKKNPDFFYGFAKDDWAAFAVGYTFLEKRRQGLI